MATADLEPTDPRPEVWNPWAALRARGPSTLVALADLGGPAGRWERDAIGDVILLDVGLDRRALRVTLAHELVHAERGIGHPTATPPTMAIEEEHVRREVARRLLPRALLLAFVDAQLGAGPVELSDVVEEFDVTAEVAELACKLLAAG